MLPKLRPSGNSTQRRSPPKTDTPAICWSNCSLLYPSVSVHPSIYPSIPLSQSACISLSTPLHLTIHLSHLPLLYRRTIYPSVSLSIPLSHIPSLCFILRSSILLSNLSVSFCVLLSHYPPSATCNPSLSPSIPLSRIYPSVSLVHPPSHHLFIYLTSCLCFILHYSVLCTIYASTSHHPSFHPSISLCLAIRRHHHTFTTHPLYPRISL